MAALASAKGVTVIATYTERPLLPAVGSSEVCRVPITLPPIDVNQVMAVVPELTIDASDFGYTARRLLASLKCRLGFKLTELCFYSVLHCRGSNDDAEQFLRDFAEAKAGIQHDTISALQECNKVSKYNLESRVTKTSNDDAVAVLLGIDDAALADPGMIQISDTFSLTEGLITFNISKLLNIFDPNIQVYDTGRNLFQSSLEAPDLFSGTPLEAAYYWTLSCRSALNKKLFFTVNDTFSIHCKYLKPGRLFPGTYSSEYDLDFLERSTIYYADERNKGSSTHPIVDLFFLTDVDELVLVNIYGGNYENFADDKREKIDAWIVKEKCNIPYKLRGVVLAPNVNMEMGELTDVVIVSGGEAIKLLGGLGQIYQWFE